MSFHQNDYNHATTPVAHAGFPTTREQCHDTVQWTDGKFDHSTTGFALTGMHTLPPRQCTDCHRNNNYNLTSTACYSCHQTDYQGMTNPNHVASNFPTGCDQRHSTSTWLNATFNHNSTGFVLTGSHTVPPRQCTDCHVNNNYNLTSTACYSCHSNDYTNALTPVNHAAVVRKMKRSEVAKSLKDMVARDGVEPPTPAFSEQASVEQSTTYKFT